MKSKLKTACFAALAACAAAGIAGVSYAAPTSVWPGLGCVAELSTLQAYMAYMPAGVVQNRAPIGNPPATFFVSCMLARTDNTMSHPYIQFDFAPVAGSSGQSLLVGTAYRGTNITTTWSFLNPAATGGGFQRVTLAQPIPCLTSDMTLVLRVQLGPNDMAGPMQLTENP